MNKQLLTISSICAVVILIGVSFTSVVGYSSKQSYSIESPLYNVRTNRAIENGEDVTTCKYLGKGKPNSIPLPILENKLVLIRQLIDRIGRIDDKILNKLIPLINYLNIIENEDEEPLATKSPPSEYECCTWHFDCPFSEYNYYCPFTLRYECTWLPFQCKGILYFYIFTMPIWIILFITLIILIEETAIPNC